MTTSASTPVVNQSPPDRMSGVSFCPGAVNAGDHGVGVRRPARPPPRCTARCPSASSRAITRRAVRSLILTLRAMVATDGQHPVVIARACIGQGQQYQALVARCGRVRPDPVHDCDVHPPCPCRRRALAGWPAIAGVRGAGGRPSGLCPGCRAQQIDPALIGSGQRANRGQPRAGAWSHVWSRSSQCRGVDHGRPAAADHPKRLA
jgi:hypothetical protein